MVKSSVIASWMESMLRKEDIDNQDYTISKQGKSISVSVGVPIEKLQELSKKYKFDVMSNEHSCGGPSGILYCENLANLAIKSSKPGTEGKIKLCFYSTS
jgi:hypothetical protein